MRKEEFIKEAAEQGGYRRAEAEASAQLFEAFCKADIGNQRDIIRQLIMGAGKYARLVMGWGPESVRDLQVRLVKSAARLNVGAAGDAGERS